MMAKPTLKSEYDPVAQEAGSRFHSFTSFWCRMAMPKYEMNNGNLLQVPDDKVGKYNLLLGKVVETKPAVVQGWSHGRNGSLDPTHSVQVLMEIKGCHFT